MAWFFVGGSQRSGTTMLQIMLCQDKSVNPMIQEAKYLRQLLAAYRLGQMQFKVETRDYFKDEAAYIEFNAGIVRAFLRQTLALFPGAKHLVLREPHLTMSFPDLARFLPKARFLCVVRDPRDVIASMIKVGEKLKQEVGGEETMSRLFNSRDIPAICRHYLGFYTRVLGSRDADFRQRLLVVRYEDLVRDPAAAVGPLRQFTGLALENYDAARDPDTGRIDYTKIEGYKKAWAAEEYAKAPTDARIGRHAEVLSRKEIAAVVETCGPFMKRFKYLPA